jgi:hypothetical protein
VSNLRRELMAILGDKARVDRVLESRAVIREIETIAKRAQGVADPTQFEPLTQAQREASEELQTFLNKYYNDNWNEKSFVGRSPSELHPLELLVFYDEAKKIGVVISFLEQAISNSLRNDNPEFRRRPLGSQLSFTEEYEPLKRLRVMKELINLWIPLALYVVSEHANKFEVYQGMLSQWEVKSSTKAGYWFKRFIQNSEK